MTAAEYHQQDTDYYCGAACALMVLQQLGAGHDSQQDLYRDNHTHSVREAGWATAPDGLAWTLNQRDPSGHGFALQEMSSEDLASRALAWSLTQGMAAPALVYGYQHWVTVVGVVTSQTPTDAQDRNYTIQEFYIHNPWPPVPAEDFPGGVITHATGDACGHGGDHGMAQEQISYSTWRSDYMTGVPVGHWQGKFITLVPPTALPAAAMGAGATTEDNLPQDVISKSAALKSARLKLAVPGGELVDLQDPVLVKRLDRDNESYYLVPSNIRGGGGIKSVVRVHAQTGEYSQMLTMSKSLPFNYELAQQEDDVTEHGTGAAGEFVWMPCLESFSPFWPFQQLERNGKTVYRRVDGKEFSKLTTDMRGA
jgi:hypothetical protein